jgi:threonine dehydrogenase-like Zn-dependent dehydrogenase
MRAVVLDEDGQPKLLDVPEPNGEGDVVRVLACGLCGSDVEKIGVAEPGTVLGHEVAAELPDGRRVALVHHLPCGECDRCRAGHESTCEQFRAATIEPGGFAERAAARGWVELPGDMAPALGTYAEPLACVLRGAERVPRGEVLVLGGGFIGRLFAAVLRERGDSVYLRDLDPARDGPVPPGPVAAVVVCARGAGQDALDLGAVYRGDITLVGSGSATPRHLEDAIRLLPALELPEPSVRPLEEFEAGLDAYMSGETLKVVFTP